MLGIVATLLSYLIIQMLFWIVFDGIVKAKVVNVKVDYNPNALDRFRCHCAIRNVRQPSWIEAGVIPSDPYERTKERKKDRKEERKKEREKERKDERRKKRRKERRKEKGKKKNERKNERKQRRPDLSI